MQKATFTHWIFVLVLIFTRAFDFHAQTLDASFSSPTSQQCIGSSIIVNATNTTYSNYEWTITGPNAFSANYTGSSISLTLNNPGAYDVSLFVTDGVNADTNTVVGYLNVNLNPNINDIPDQIVCGHYTLPIITGTNLPGNQAYYTGVNGTGSTISVGTVISSSQTIYMYTSTTGGCSDQQSFVVTINPVASVTAQTQSICSGSAFTLTPSGVPAGTTYTWALPTIVPVVSAVTGSTAETTGTESITQTLSLTAGTVTSSSAIYTITPLSGTCQGNPFTLTVTVNPIPVVSGQTATACSGTAFSITPTGVPTGTTYIWITPAISPPGTLIGGSAQSTGQTAIGQTLTNVTTSCGIATYTVTPRTGSCVGSTFIVVVTVCARPIATNKTATICSGTSFTVTPNDITIPAGTTYSWSAPTSNPSGAITGVANSSQQNISESLVNTTISSAIAIYTVTPTSGSCTGNSFTVAVVVNPSVSVTAQSVSACSGAAFTFNPTPAPTGTTYTWALPTIEGALSGSNEETIGATAITQTLTLNAGAVTSSTATYTVTPLSGTCTGNPFNLTATITPTATISAQTATICSGATFTISPIGVPIGTSYAWSAPSVSPTTAVTGSSAQSGQTNISQALTSTITSAATVTYTVTPTSGTCTISTFTTTVTINPTPIVNPTPDQSVCAEVNVPSTSFNGSSPNILYQWIIDNTTIGIPNSGTGSIPSFQAQNSTSTNQISTIQVYPFLNGCQGAPDTFLIIVRPLPTVNPSPDQTVCANNITLPVNFTGAINGTVFNWFGSENIGIFSMSGSGNIPSFSSFNGSQNDIIDSIIVTPSLNGCVGVSDTFSIIVRPISTVISVSDQTVCSSDSTSQIVFSGSNLNNVYYWTNNNSSIGIPSTGTGPIPSFQAQNISSIDDVATFIVTPSLNGCQGDPDTFLITVRPLPTVNAGNDVSICSGSSYVPSATGNGATFLWSDGLINGISFTPTASTNLTVIGSLNGCTASDQIQITVLPNPIVTVTSLDGEDSLSCDGSVSVTVVSGTAPFVYNWSNGVTTAPNQNLCSGTYLLTVSDMNGCITNTSVTINDTLINTPTGDTLIFTDNIYLDSTIVGADTSAWIENCTFDYTMVTGATIDSYVNNGDSTIVTWIISLSDGNTIPVSATYFLSPGTAGVYDLTLQVYCSQKSGPKFLFANSRLYYEGNVSGVETNFLNTIYLYPNPTKSTISISGINTDFSYKIVDLQGKLLKQGANENQIDMVGALSGHYYITIITEKEVTTLKFVKY